MSGALIMGVEPRAVRGGRVRQGPRHEPRLGHVPAAPVQGPPEGHDGGRAADSTCRRPARASRRLPPSAAAIANAFFDATGVRLHEAPMTAGGVRATLEGRGRRRRARRPAGAGPRPGSPGPLPFLDSRRGADLVRGATSSSADLAAGRGARRLRARRCSRATARRSSPTAPGAGYTPLRELIAQWFGVHPSASCSRTAGCTGSRCWPRRSCAGARASSSSTRSTPRR